MAVSYTHLFPYEHTSAVSVISRNLASFHIKARISCSFHIYRRIIDSSARRKFSFIFADGAAIHFKFCSESYPYGSSILIIESIVSYSSSSHIEFSVVSADYDSPSAGLSAMTVLQSSSAKDQRSSAGDQIAIIAILYSCLLYTSRCV